jgi:VanZ family protein
VPFFFLALAWTLLSWRTGRRLVTGHAAIVALMVLTELGQILLPDRHAGLMDILWGLVGLSTGGLTGLLYLFQKSQAQAQSQSQS